MAPICNLLIKKDHGSCWVVIKAFKASTQEAEGGGPVFWGKSKLYNNCQTSME